MHKTELVALKPAEQRFSVERRTFTWRTFVYASVYRRRAGTRREQDVSLLAADQLPISSSLLALIVVGLSILDALFTTELLNRGAVELNPFMNYLILHDTAWFALVKIKLTGLCVIALVFLANHEFLGLFKTGKIVQLVMTGYLYLIAWELFLLL